MLEWNFKPNSIQFCRTFFMLQQNIYVQKGTSIQAVYLCHKNQLKLLLVAEIHPSPSSPFLPEHPWHFPASSKCGYGTWLTQWNVNKSEKHHSPRLAHKILPHRCFFSWLLRMSMTLPLTLEAILRMAECPLSWIPELPYREGLPHQPVHRSCSICISKKTLALCLSFYMFASTCSSQGWIQVLSILNLHNLRGHLYKKECKLNTKFTK